MKNKIENQVKITCKHYKITDIVFITELIESYQDQYQEYLKKGHDEKEAYLKTVNSLDDLVYYEQSNFKTENNNKSLIFILVYSIINIIGILFYVFSKQYSLFQTDYSISIFIVASIILGIIIFLINLFWIKENPKIIIKNILYVLTLYVPIVLYEVDGGITNSIFSSVLSYYTASIVLIILIYTLFEKKFTLKSMLLIISGLFALISRFTISYPIVSSLLILTAASIIVFVVIKDLWLNLFNQNRKSKNVILGFTILVVGIILELLLSKYSRLNIALYQSIMLLLITVMYVFYEKIFKNINGMRHIYRAGLIYIVILLIVQFINMVYQITTLGFNYGVTNFYSIQISVLITVISLVQLIKKQIKKEKITWKKH